MTTEAELLAAVRDAPGDDAARAVYADWLEQHGEEARAAFVRGEEVAEIRRYCEAAWRALTSRARVEDCGRDACPGTWDRLAPTDVERVRGCAACGRYPVYCVELEEADTAEANGHPVVRDVDVQVAVRMPAVRVRAPYKSGPIRWNPPPPRRPRGRTMVDGLSAFEIARRIVSRDE